MTAINAANMYGMYPNAYNNIVALNDLTNMDMYPPSPMMYDPMMTMNGSIFGDMSGMGYPMGGGLGMTNPMMMPTFGGGFNYENMYQNMERNQDFMIDYQVRQQEKMRNADLRLNSPEEGIAKKAQYLHDKIERNEQDQIQGAYNDFIASVRSMYPQGSEEEIANRASSLYSRLNGGTSIIEDVRKNGRGSFEQGFIQTITLGLADKKTAEENVSDLTGQPVGKTEQMKKLAGNAAGGAIFGGAALCLLGPLFKALKITGKNKTFWGLLAGGIVGIGATIATSKNS